MQPHYTPSIEYFAGFFDGEGYILMRKRPAGTHRLEIGINCTHLPILECFQRQFAGTIRRSDSGTNKQMYQWVLGSIADCLCFLRQIQPFLIEKSQQADLGIQWLEHRSQFVLRGVVARYDMAFADDLTQRIKALKHVSL